MGDNTCLSVSAVRWLVTNAVATNGCNGPLMAGVYGSSAKGFSNPKFSDIDYYVPTTLTSLQAQQFLFKNQEHFESKISFEECDLKYPRELQHSQAIDRQFKLVPLQHYVAQIFGANYDFCCSVLNNRWQDRRTNKLWGLIAKYVLGYTNLTTVMHARGRNDYPSTVKNYLFEVAGGEPDEIHKASSRFIGALHGHMIAMVIASGAATSFKDIPQHFLQLLELYKQSGKSDTFYPIQLLSEQYHRHISGVGLLLDESSVEYVTQMYARQKEFVANKIVALSNEAKKEAYALQSEIYKELLEVITKV